MIFRCGLVLVLIACFGRFALAQDMPLSQILIEDQGWELVGQGYKFTEGPAVDANGTVYFTDVPEDKIYKIGADGKVSLFNDQSYRTNGLMFGPGGKLFGCRNGERQIAIYDASGGATPLAEDVQCNDLVVTRSGGVYFTDPANKQVWYVSPQGEKRVVDKGIERPNGIILWPDQKTLIVADTGGPHLWTFRIEKDGSLSHKQPYYTMRMLPGRKASGADGMTVDRDGRLYVATYAGLQVFDTQARLSGVLLKPQDKFLSNVVFGGPKMDTLYITCSDKVYRRKTKVQGVRFFEAAK